MAKIPCNVPDVLGCVLSGESIEALMDEVLDPGANLTKGQLAMLGGAFEALSKHFTEAAKSGLEGVRVHVDTGDVLFKWKDPYPQTRVDTDMVKRHFPEATFPQLYKKSDVAGSVSVELPFDKAKIRLPGN